MCTPCTLAAVGLAGHGSSAHPCTHTRAQFRQLHARTHAHFRQLHPLNFDELGSIRLLDWTPSGAKDLLFIQYLNRGGFSFSRQLIIGWMGARELCGWRGLTVTWDPPKTRDKDWPVELSRSSQPRKGIRLLCIAFTGR